MRNCAFTVSSSCFTTPASRRFLSLKATVCNKAFFARSKEDVDDDGDEDQRNETEAVTRPSGGLKGAAAPLNSKSRCRELRE